MLALSVALSSERMQAKMSASGSAATMKLAAQWCISSGDMSCTAAALRYCINCLLVMASINSHSSRSLKPLIECQHLLDLESTDPLI